MPIWTKSYPQPVKITVLLTERYSNLCLAQCLEPLRAANAFAARQVYDWRICGLTDQSIKSSSGLTLMPDGTLDDSGTCDLLMVLSSYGHLSLDTPQVRRALARAATRAKTVVGFDAAPWLLASAGLLAGRRATLHADLRPAFAERFLDVTLEETALVQDGNRITCAGALAAYDFARARVVQDLGQAAGLDLDALFLAHDRPMAGQPPAPLRRDPLVNQAMAVMRGALETPLSLNQISATLKVTPRTLTRRCFASLGASPGTVYRHMRLSAALQLVQDTCMPVSEVALRCGYEDPTALTRAFRKRFGRSPRDMRQGQG